MSAAKHGMVGLSKVIALEGAEAGVTCNTVCPGYVRTPLVEKQVAEQAKAHGISEERVIADILLKEQPTRRFVDASDIGAMVLFLVSDAADAVTGTALPIDGGWTAH
ncbi:SDR family oxidoreductase [Elstera litoralis]|uniref:SDR family oxidoreductase n=1 Tax=Elstera litoralis TaxID=552518 RepID=UPI000A80B781